MSLKYNMCSNLNSVALGLISTLRPDIKKSLLWALRYELDPYVRASAAHSLVLLAGNEDIEILDALQERYLIDSDPIAKKYELFFF